MVVYRLLAEDKSNQLTYYNKRYKVYKAKLVAKGVVEPVEDGGPALHRDALEHGQHGVDDVVE